MAWTTPLTAVANATLTAAQWNASVRDNLNETAPALFDGNGQYIVSTGPNTCGVRAVFNAYNHDSDTTTSTSYDDMSVAGPTVSRTSGTLVAVFVTAGVVNSVGGTSLMSFEMSGATTVAADDAFAVGNTSPAGEWIQASTVIVRDANPGSTTYTSKYRVTSGTGTFQFRRIAVMPF